MNPGVLLTTFALVLPAELPDKTFIASIVMASRHRPLPVFAGGAAALVLQAALAVVAGRLLALLPATAVKSVVAALFVLGAAYLLFVPERREMAGAEEIEARDPNWPPLPSPATAPAAGAAPAARRAPEWLRVSLATFSLVALAEFGDITQLLIANLTARYHDPLSVFTGAAAAFVCVSAAAVIGGRFIVRVLPLSVVRRISGLALLGFGVFEIVSLL